MENERSNERASTVGCAAPEPVTFWSVLRAFVFIPFYSFCYTPFCISLLLLSSMKRIPLDPSDWELPRMQVYWIIALFLFFCALIYSCIVGVIVPEWLEDKTYCWPLLGVSFIFHLFTVDYVVQRPELRNIKPAGRLRFCVLRNWSGFLVLAIEFAQLVSCVFSPEITWFPSSGGTKEGLGIFDVLKRALEACLVLFNDPTANLVASTTIVLVFVLLVGDFIYHKRCVSSPFGAALYDGLAGFMFLTVLASLLRVGKRVSTPWEASAVLLGLLFYTTPAVFVGVYRGDLRELKSDVNYSPYCLVRERVAKEVFGIAVVYGLDGHVVAKIACGLSLGLYLLWILRDPSQYSCAPVVRVRRLVILFALWILISALVVLYVDAKTGRRFLIGGTAGFLTTCVLWVTRNVYVSYFATKNEDKEHLRKNLDNSSAHRLPGKGAQAQV